MSEKTKKLYRSRDERMIAGVCGGIGEYFDLDPTLVRLGFVLFSIPFPFMIFAYLVMMVIIPNEPQSASDFPTEELESTSTDEQ